MTPQQSYSGVVPEWMGRIRGDFNLSELDAAAIFGNGGYESLGFTKLQEMAPTVKGSRGGWGLMQWTGSRRRAFEKWCTRTGRSLSSIEANYAWLYLELKGSEKHAIAALKAATTLDAKVIAFEKAFLRAGVKNYAKRQEWAAVALKAYKAAGSPVTAPEWTAKPGVNPTKPSAPAETAAKGGAAAAGALALAFLASVPWWVWLGIPLVVLAAWVIWPRRHAIATHLRLAMGKL